MTWLTAVEGGVRLHLHIQPRASKTEIVGVHGDALKIRLAAPPVDGAANEALIRYIAKTLAVPRTAVALHAGASSRRKTVEVQGQDVEEVRARLLPA